MFSFLTLLGGLSIFIFGMTVMGEGLEKCGGSKLKTILESMTQNPLRGVLLGAGVTAIIQSSSATTVMVVGFVNSGIMKLSQSISIIMGANIGTTVTAWLLSLTGLQSDNVIISLLKPTSFSPVLAFVGIIMMMAAKNPRRKDVGSVLVGFAVLITGMEMMSGSVAGLKDNETFTSILTLFSNPILGILTGALLTAIIQSSSASVGILQALSTTGRITYSNAIPIILGQNIGTCVTALLSSLGTTKNARRSAIVHLCFNLIAASVFAAAFYTLNAFIHFSFIGDSVNAAGIAVVHTIFNITGTAVMLPFTKQLEKLTYLIIKDDSRYESNRLLDERLLLTPPVALSHARSIASDMARISKDSLISSLSLADEYNDNIITQIAKNEETVDQYEDALGTYLVKLCRESLTVEDSHQVTSILHSIGDFERICDHAVNLCEVAGEMHDKSIHFSNDAEREIKTMRNALTEILELTFSAFFNEDAEIARKIEPLEETVDILRTKFKENHVLRLKSGECTIENGFIFSDYLINCERVADHCSNVAVCMLEIANDSFGTHEYLNKIKDERESEFTKLCEFYRKKYAI